MLEAQYAELPWPAQLQRGIVFTETRGGLGDVTASAKVLALVQQMAPHVQLSWVVTDLRGHDGQSFLRSAGVDLSRVEVGTEGLKSVRNTADFLIRGPVETGWGLEDLIARFALPLAASAPTFKFVEIAADAAHLGVPRDLRIAARALRKGEAWEQAHPFVFPDHSYEAAGLTMGLKPGQGLLLGPPLRTDRLPGAKLSLLEGCRSLEDTGLCNDMLASKGARPLSFNFGYAHWPRSWNRFVEFVTAHEPTYDVLIVLNQEGEFVQVSALEFGDALLTPWQVAQLTAQGFGRVVVKDAEQQIDRKLPPNPSMPPVGAPALPGARTLTVVLRPRFTAHDMRQLQRMAQRLLATGDNTAIEAWTAGCDLFMYEDVDNGGSKKHFVQQQVDLAAKVSPQLARVIELGSLTRALSDAERAESLTLLRRADLAPATKQMCQTICAGYDFRDTLCGALKRSMWQQVLPRLVEVEAAAVAPALSESVSAFIQRGDAPFTATLLPEHLAQVAATLRAALDDAIQAKWGAVEAPTGLAG